MSILVLDLGTTTVRATAVDPESRLHSTRTRRLPPRRPSAGIAEFDPTEVANVAIGLANEVIADVGAVSSVGITAQRASTVLFDASNGEPLGPGLGWQDQRTVGTCVALRAQGIRLAPNQSATKLTYLLDLAGRPQGRDLRFSTLESWLCWRLSGGSLHVTDATNAAVTGLVTSDALGWDPERLTALGIDLALLPRIVDSSELLGSAEALSGAPPIAALIGDQQASLIGQACLELGDAKITFGSGGMLDCCVGDTRPEFTPRGPAGTFPIVTRRIDDRLSWGIEGILLAAGTCIEWLRDRLGLIGDASETSELAASVRDSGGVSFVPAFGGLGTPLWDFGARGSLLGLDASTTKAEVVHAVLEGIANAGADLLEAAELDSARSIEQLRVDGGMAANDTFLQLLANACARPILRSSVIDATTRGAAFLAGAADGTWASLTEAAALVRPLDVIEPTKRLDRDRWREARSRALGYVPFLSALEF